MEAGQNSERKRPWRTPGNECNDSLNELEALYFTLTERLEALVDEGPFIDGETSECLTCGNHRRTGWRNNKEPHAPNCPWLLAKQALEEQGNG